MEAPRIYSAAQQTPGRVKKIVRKNRKARSTQGAAEAKAAAKMTTEEFKALQVGMDEKWPAPEYMATPIPGRSHTNYRDETYEIVTRWTADTKIAYRPHAKSPGSKSHIRYEIYMKARTVGETLKMGTLPADWCWDYERGFIKVLGPVRDEPIDITEHTEDGSPLTDVDRAIYRWYNKELAKKLNVNYRDLFGTSDSSILRAHRLVAEREADARLAAAEKANRKISNEDIAAVMKAWAFVKNSARSNVIPDGGAWVWSDTVGLIRDRGGSIHVTPPTKLYPAVMEILVKYLNDRLPPNVKDFTYTSINLNYNYAARLHRDGNNFGPSFIKAFGDFTGGELNYYEEDDKSLGLDELPNTGSKPAKLQIGPGPDGGLALFNGNSAHSVDDFTGDRFSVVYFTLGCHARAEEDQREIMRNVGIPVPAREEDCRKYLRAPRGYDGKTRSVQGSEKNLPTMVFFKNSELEKMPAQPRVGNTSRAKPSRPSKGGKSVQKRALKETSRKLQKAQVMKRPAAKAK